MSKYLREKLPELGFIQTDEKQFVKEITKYGFMVYDEDYSGLVFFGVVRVLEDEFTNNMVKMYYDGGIAEVKEKYEDEWRWIVAEIIAECSEHDEE